MAECGAYIGAGVVSYPCTLEPGHAGPCYAVENAKSVREREAWEETERNRTSGLAEFQGPAQTTAQRYTENASPTPESPEHRQERLEAKLRHPTTPPGEMARVDVSRAKEALRSEEPGGPLSEARTRPEDQPLPTIHPGAPFIQDLVIADIEERKQIGIRRYGTPLQAHNERDALLDAYQEALGLCMYLKQALVERDVTSPA
jgi:hypothetical protein